MPLSRDQAGILFQGAELLVTPNRLQGVGTMTLAQSCPLGCAQTNPDWGVLHLSRRAQSAVNCAQH